MLESTQNQCLKYNEDENSLIILLKYLDLAFSFCEEEIEFLNHLKKRFREEFKELFEYQEKNEDDSFLLKKFRISENLELSFNLKKSSMMKEIQSWLNLKEKKIELKIKYLTEVFQRRMAQLFLHSILLY